MNAKILATLEYSKIIKMLLEQAATSIGKEYTETLSPSTDFETVKQKLTLTDEAFAVDRLKGSPPFGGIVNIKPALHRARIHGTLNGQELYEVATTSRGSRYVKRFLQQAHEEHSITSLLSISEQISEHRDLEEAIFQAIDDQGYVLDQALSLIHI